jgi:hypothetical protein
MSARFTDLGAHCSEDTAPRPVQNFDSIHSPCLRLAAMAVSDTCNIDLICRNSQLE